jgi:hypothetical protein
VIDVGDDAKIASLAHNAPVRERAARPDAGDGISAPLQQDLSTSSSRVATGNALPVAFSATEFSALGNGRTRFLGRVVHVSQSGQEVNPGIRSHRA